MFVLYSLIFIGGLMAGSFLNCVIYRLEVGESFFGGRSYCPHCRHQLGFFDLVPILSFVLLRGRCRYCQKSISIQYPLVELATACLFVLFFLHFGFGLDLIFGFLILGFLVIIFVYDLKHYLIPDSVVYPAIAIAFLYRLFEIFNFELVSDYLLPAILAASFFLSIVLISKETWMGMGDVKLGFLMGLLLGWPNTFVALFLAVFLGAIIGMGLIALGKKKMKSEVPFGPFLIIGTFAALFWADELINWYLNFFIFL